MKQNHFPFAVQAATLALLTFAITMAHAAAPSNDTLYTVQLGIFQDVTIADFDDIRKAGYLYAKDIDQGRQMNIFIGNHTRKVAAEKTLEYVLDRGYSTAFITERPLAKGQRVHVVQVASVNQDDYIDWEKYAAAGQAYIMLENKQVKITSVPYANVETAKQKATALQKLGFDGAFVKIANTLELHQVGMFNTVKQVDFATAATSSPDAAAPNLGGGIVPSLPGSLSESDLSPKIPTGISKESRQSVKSLQLFLKGQSSYARGVDGIYGTGTADGLQLWEGSNSKYRRYQTLAKEIAASSTGNESLSSLEQAIISIPTDADAAYTQLSKENAPVAKAYQAYILFVTDAQANQQKVNDLMNQAISEAYKGFEGEAPFDYQSRYSYTDLEQLILHTRYIQAAMKQEPITPCWLFVKHKDEAHRAFGRATAKGLDEAKMQNCTGFMQWDNIIMLKTISTDLNPKEDSPSAEQLRLERSHASLRNRLYLIPRPLDAMQEKAAVQWNDDLWAAMDKRTAEDEFFAKFAIPFKLAYHKAWVELEDYYLEKGFKSYQANAIALAVLQSVVEVDVMGYISK